MSNLGELGLKKVFNEDGTVKKNIVKDKVVTGDLSQPEVKDGTLKITVIGNRDEGSTSGTDNTSGGTYDTSGNNKNKGKDRGTQLKGEKLKRTYRDRGGVLRYPFEALTERTDYLQIDINQYESARERSGNENNLIGRVGTRRLSTRGRNPFGLTTKSLVNKGTILLQIPSQVQDGNSVNYGESEMKSFLLEHPEVSL